MRLNRFALVAIVLAVALAGLALTACSPKVDTDPAKLPGTWELKGFGAPDGLRDADPTLKTKLSLTADGKAFGNTGINEFRGAYVTKGTGDIRFGQPTTTRAAGSAAAMQQESEFLKVLELAEHYEFGTDGYLVLTGNNNDTLAVFTPRPADPVPTSTPAH